MSARALALSAALLAVPAMAQAQEPVEAAMQFAADACIFAETGDIATPFAAMQERARASGLPVVVEDEKTGIYGDLGALHAIVTAGVDSLTCVVKIPAAMIDHVGFEALEAAVNEQFAARHPGFLTTAKDDPSPHIDGRSWVIDTAAKDHIAATLSFATEDGVQFATAAQKTYE
ncbi:MAG TPA: hypothetical protein ENK63_02340 [Rhodobacterales bacterium]|nr:hypothetical protein [Rhodobacterales bacterium]